MSIRNLHSLFQPHSIAVIGASQKAHSVGATVLENLVAGGFSGAIFPVNPKYTTLAGRKVYAKISDLPSTPELAVICTPPATVPGIIAELGKRGTKAAIVQTAGLDAQKNAAGKTLGKTMQQAMLDAAKPTLLRILGPNCVGMLVPGLGINASFAHTGALAGKIAFVSQSGAMVTGVLDWAKSRHIGFSKFISLGDSADVDFGDVLDYLASDASTSAILLYVENIKAARKFMSAARAAARNKPVLILKAGRVPEGAKAAASHTGALVGSDDVYDAAIRRAGMLRVFTTEDLFAAVETLAGARSDARSVNGNRLAIMSNGGGPGVMATDALILGEGRLAALSDATLNKLNEILPATWSRGNPINVISDAPAQRYVQTMEILLTAPEVDAVLFIHAPTAVVSCAEIAAAVAPLAQHASRNILACWLGGDAVAQARHIFSEAGIPTFATPEDAVRGFMQIVQFHRNQNLLMEVPPSIPVDFVPDRGAAQAIIGKALAEGRTLLSEPEAMNVLAAYGIPVVDTLVAQSIPYSVAHAVEHAVQQAQKIGFPVAIKILSPDIGHKSDVGGVVLDLDTPEAVRLAASAMLQRLRGLRPTAELQGFSVQAMARRPDAHELIVGVATDPTFGPVILFGQGGIAVEITADRAIGLPPLNMNLARDLVSRTRVAKLLAGYRNRPAADVDAICRTLIQISQLIIDLPQIVELDINPLLADANGVIALDALIHLSASNGDGVERLAIRPYPEQLEERITWQDQPLLLRPIRPEDGAQYLAFFKALTPEDIRMRMFISMRELQATQLARLTQVDYDREMAFVAVRPNALGESEMLGVVRAIADPDNVNAEFAISVRSDFKGKGLGKILMRKLVDYCRNNHTQKIIGETMSQNRPLLELVRKFDFEITRDPGEETTHLSLDLHAVKDVKKN